mmetsp:Transcript_8993/g.19876  ORF Transcript_8993/g.19876 Transcript_8993/m.19876 type:complete len:232 (+) Transcript_8993:730-1425(+)
MVLESRETRVRRHAGWFTGTGDLGHSLFFRHGSDHRLQGLAHVSVFVGRDGRSTATAADVRELAASKAPLPPVFPATPMRSIGKLLRQEAETINLAGMPSHGFPQVIDVPSHRVFIGTLVQLFPADEEVILGTPIFDVLSMVRQAVLVVLYCLMHSSEVVDKLAEFCEDLRLECPHGFSCLGQLEAHLQFHIPHLSTLHIEEDVLANLAAVLLRLQLYAGRLSLGGLKTTG